MDIIQAAVLGLVQGIGEFLPISSTAHLAIVPYFFGWKDPGLSFDVALHAGTLIAVLGYFWKDWVNILKSAFQDIIDNFQFPVLDKPFVISDQNFNKQYSSSLVWLILVATIPGAFAGFLLESYAETTLRNPLIIAFSLAFFGLLLLLVDKYGKKEKKIDQVSLWDSIIIGLAQAVAIIPGVSRSGATMTAGLFQGMTRQAAARFSFLLSTPIILGATLSQLSKIFNGEFETMPLLVGIFVSALSGYWAISFLLKFLQKASYAVFFWYRLVLAVVILAAYYTV